MALEQRYMASADHVPSGTEYLLEISQEGFAGSVQTLALAQGGLSLSLKPTDQGGPFWKYATDTLEVTVLDPRKDKSPTVLVGILRAREQEVKADLYVDGLLLFSGWLKPKTISFNRYLPETTSMTFVGGIGFLPYQAYGSGGAAYTGRVRAITALRDALDLSGFNRRIKTAMAWTTEIGSNEIDFSTKDPLQQFTINRQGWLNENNDPVSADAALNQIAAGFQLQVFAWRNEWYALQRDRSAYLSGNTVSLWNHANDLVDRVVTTEDHRRALDWVTRWPQAGFTTVVDKGTQASRVTYQHGTVNTAIIGNPGFEAPIQATTGDGIDNWKPSSVDIERRNAPRSNAWSLFIPAIYNTGTPFATSPADILPWLTKKIEQTAGYLEGGQNRFFNFKAYARYLGDGDTTITGTGTGYTAVRVRIGSHWITKDAAGNYGLSTSPVSNQHWHIYSLGFPRGFLDVDMGQVELYSGGSPVNGNVFIEMYNVAEDADGDGHGLGILWDDVDFTVIDEGEEAPEATTTQCTDTGSTDFRVETGEDLFFGSGPTDGHVRRMRIFNDLDTEVEAPSNFQKGDTYGSPSGMSHASLWCDERLKQSQVPLARIAGTIDMGRTTALTYEPFHILQDSYVGETAGASIIGSTILETDVAFLPLRNITVGSDTRRVLRVEEQAGGTYYLYLESGMSQSHLAGETVTQALDFTWEELTYDLLENTVSGTWCELYEGDGGVGTEVKLAPGSQLGGTTSFSGTSITQVFQSDNARVVESMADLLLTDVGPEVGAIVLQSYHAGLEKGGGVWVGDPDDTTTPIDGGTVVASNDSRRWKRVVDGPFDPTWFGARFDGSTDDSAAIQQCIDSVPNHGTVRMPPGIARIDTGIVIDGRPVTIEGSGDSYWADTGYLGVEFPPESGQFPYPFPPYPDWGGTVLRSGPALATPMFTIQDTVTDSERRNAVRIRYLHLVGNNGSVNEGTGTDTFGIYVLGAWWAKIEHCSINNFTSHGVAALTAQTGVGNVTDLLQIVSCHISGNGGWGVSANCPDGWISKCRISDNFTGGVLMGSSQMQIKDSWVDVNKGIGIRANGTKANMISNCIVNANASVGIWIGNGTTSVRNYHVHGNHVSNNGQDIELPLEQRAGIWVMGGADHVVSDNVCFDDATEHTQTYGIYISSGWRNVRMLGNVFAGNSIDPTNFVTNNPEGVYNVLEHGLQQRTIDCASHLQALIDLVDEGSTLYFPEGNYLMESTVVVSKAMRFLGQATDDLAGNEGSYIQSPVGLDAPAFQVLSGGVSFERLNFFGNVGAPSTAAVGVSFEAGTGGRVDGCMFSNYRGPGAKVVAPAANVWINDSTFIGGASHGVLNQASNVRVHGCEFRQNDGHGIYCLTANDARVSDNFVWQNGLDGIRFEGGNRCFAHSNTSRENAQAGIRIQSGSKHAADGNVCNGNGTDIGVADIHRTGIALIGGDRISACHNYLGSSRHGMTFGAALVSAVVLENRFDDLDVSAYLWEATSQPALDIDLFGRATVNLGSISAGSTATTNVTLDGVLAGDAVMVGAPSNWPATLLAFASCTADDTIRLVAFNTTGGAVDPPEGEWSFVVSRRGGTATAAPPPATTTLSMEHSYENPNILEYA